MYSFKIMDVSNLGKPSLLQFAFTTMKELTLEHWRETIVISKMESLLSSLYSSNT
jgi:hypothetical protein